MHGDDPRTTAQSIQEYRSMPFVTADDGVRLYYEEAGSGTALIFVHEFAGDLRSYETQMRYFARRYRCVAYNARGYPPSDVPDGIERYSQDRARDDLRSVIDGLGIQSAHVVGISMGAFATLHLGLDHSDKAKSLVVAGCGYGADPAVRAQFEREAEAAADRFERLSPAQAANTYALGPTRVQLQNKDPRGWEEFRRMLAEHSSRGAALTLPGSVNPVETYHPVGGARDPAVYRPCSESGGAGSVQFAGCRFSRSGGERALAPARSTLHRHPDSLIAAILVIKT
jgi:pimeloyl-ACP methyl ester carboxylesterase